MFLMAEKELDSVIQAFISDVGPDVGFGYRDKQGEQLRTFE